MLTPGILYTISAPSGAGKTSLVNAIIAEDDNITVSISHTTRAMRQGEENGKNYHFIDKATFRDMISAGDFIEYAEVFEHLYGTSKQSIHAQLHQGLDVILEIDWQGARQIKAIYPDSTGIFIFPPSKEALLKRLQGRGQDSTEIINKRMQQAVREMSHYDEYDYIIINEDFNVATKQLLSIFKTGRLKKAQQIVKNASLIKELLV